MKNSLPMGALFGLLIIVDSLSTASAASIITIDNYTELRDGYLVENYGYLNFYIDSDGRRYYSQQPVPPGDPLLIFSMTFSTLDPDIGFSAWPRGTPDDPGDGSGYGYYYPLIVNFSAPLAAFGASFFHMFPQNWDVNFTDPATLTVFDGPNGTGNSLGSISSSGYQGTCTQSCSPDSTTDFVGIWSDELNIRSAVLNGTGVFQDEILYGQGFAVDEYAISFTPVPISPTTWLFGSGLLGLIGIARRKKAA